MDSNVAEVTASLVREFLSRKGLKNTLAVLDRELPRTDQSISKRTALARAVHIESLVKRNKTDKTTATSPSSSHQTILELLVQHVINNPIEQDASTVGTCPAPIPQPTVAIPTDGKPITYYSQTPTKTPTKTHRVTSTGLVSTNSRRSKNKVITGLSASIPAAVGPTEGKGEGPLTSSSGREGFAHGSTSDCVVEHEVLLVKKPPLTAADEHLMRQNSTRTCDDMLVFDDIEETIQVETVPPLGRVRAPPPPNTRPKGTPIELHTAQGLRQRVFGTSVGRSFTDEWRMQGFTFQSLPQLTYGLVQHKGGPCGLLACVQAYILQHILFTAASSSATDDKIPELSPVQQNNALVDAISSILWKVCTNNNVTVTLKSLSTAHNELFRKSDHRYSPDGITEHLILYHINDLAVLNEFIHKNIQSFTLHNDGAILFLYSVILSHGLDSFRNEVDDSSTVLVGSHGYCCQELVNLMLTGKATSNVFDGQVTIDGSVLRGVATRCDIGYLTLFEHYGACKVGKNYKNPSLPIWVVCSESHYSVLFGLSKDLMNNKKKFILHYYDGLAHLTDPVVLDISVGHKGREDKYDLIPPLELIIKTRWSNYCAVNWSCEPLL